ncbi:MAG: ATP-dependent RecD-like DNA helicase [Campylobacteraceae bacterium]|jgi:energy-coupling factor transporter ATP-binding protein EcfA2|nr:ATP-dependent RecD-like DNA helicase [Campylobacteraceae bacterium]
MASSQETIDKIDKQIQISSNSICRHIDSLDFLNRGAVSQDILKKLRDFVEHIMLKIYCTDIHDVEYNYDNICKAIDFVKTKGELKFLWKLHAYLQIVASHYTLDPENSERIILKYYEYLLKIKNFLKDKYAINVLENLDKFPLDADKSLQEYYEKIAEKLNKYDTAFNLNSARKNRFYIHKIKPFFVNQHVYYEVTFILANDKTNKFDRTIAFTVLDISKYYAVNLYIVDDKIRIFDKTMPIFIIVGWETSIRQCEIRRLSSILGTDIKDQSKLAEYRGLMKYLTQTGFNLIDLLCFKETYYKNAKTQILSYFRAKASHIFNLFDRAREIIKNNKSGSNVLRYLLYRLNNKIIAGQIDKSNPELSGLHLNYGCIPFDEMPFSTSLLGHNPKLSDLFDCIDATNRAHEILARFIRNNIELRGQLYTSIKELADFNNIDMLIRTYNQALYRKHTGRKLLERNKHLYIREYEDDTLFIINKLIELSKNGIQSYSNSVDEWMIAGIHPIDCDEKKDILRNVFENSTVALIYGSAGTGKSTLINHISHFFSKQNKLYLSNTNPAVDNLKRRVNAQNCEFMTITKFLKRQGVKSDYNLLIIDECSTVSNRNMRDILKKARFDLLILVGDIYQIEAIQFGNWFGAAYSFLPKMSVYELFKPYRSKNKELIALWNMVRKIDDTIIELIAKQNYSVSLNASIFNRTDIDEIILCLNYDGLYGINNINRFLQESNPKPAIWWGFQLYKIGDPILFNESERFAPLIYNNMKGWIVNIILFKNKIWFDIELDKVINGLEARDYEFNLLPNLVNGHSVIRFFVNKGKNAEEDDISSSTIVPFQIAYAVSIHKAQGLEYNSVKIVITDEVDELITHSIFYTAITRARNKLKIYWTPEVERRVLSSIKPKNNDKDVEFLKQAMTSYPNS